MIADRWEVLLPGAAHASTQRAFFGGLRMYAGKQLALSCQMPYSQMGSFGDTSYISYLNDDASI